MTTEPLLAGQTVIVTGASRGIGAAMSIELAAHGANVVVNYRHSAEAAAAVVDEIRGSGGSALAFQADVENRDCVKAMIAATLDEYGTIDTLVNNAYPGFQPGDIADVEWEVYRRVMESMMSAAVYTTQAVLPTMRGRKRGSIVNIGTTALTEMNYHHTPYTTGKGALLALTRGLARDLGPDNIRVNMVSPGPTWTDRTSPQPDDFAPSQRAHTPMGRVANASEVAGAVVFFSSELSGFITGIHVPVCGGMLMTVS